MSSNDEDYEFVEKFGWKAFSEEVNEAFEIFFQNTELGYDKDGNVIRTNKKRVHPRQNNNDFLFGKYTKKCKTKKH
jgi:hypothetical protein